MFMQKVSVHRHVCIVFFAQPTQYSSVLNVGLSTQLNENIALVEIQCSRDDEPTISCINQDKT